MGSFALLISRLCRATMAKTSGSSKQILSSRFKRNHTIPHRSAIKLACVITGLRIIPRDRCPAWWLHFGRTKLISRISKSIGLCNFRETPLGWRHHWLCPNYMQCCGTFHKVSEALVSALPCSPWCNFHLKGRDESSHRVHQLMFNPMWGEWKVSSGFPF